MENNTDGSYIFVLHQDTYVMHRTEGGGQHTATSTTWRLINDLVELQYRAALAGTVRTIGLSDDTSQRICWSSRTCTGG